MIVNKTAAITCKNPVTGNPKPPKSRNKSAIILMIFVILNVVFIISIILCESLCILRVPLWYSYYTKFYKGITEIHEDLNFKLSEKNESYY